MSSPAEEAELPVEEDVVEDEVQLDGLGDERERSESAGDRDFEDQAPEMSEEVLRSTSPMSLRNGELGQRYNVAHNVEGTADELSEHTIERPDSPAESMGSLPDDTPSIQGSVLSSPSSSVMPSIASRPGLGSPTPSFRPFDRRFQSRLSITPSSQASSPAFLASHSRNVSLTSSHLNLDQEEPDTNSPPWEVIRWIKLKRINGQAFSEAGKRNFGTPTWISVSASIVLGTSKGIILVFDYHQNLKSIIGLGTKAIESGPVTSVAISADHSCIAGGHANGSIFTWDTARSARPFLHIQPLEGSQLSSQSRTADGHFPDVSITHLGFLGTRHTALVSANDKGMAFSHLASRGTGSLGRSVKTTRILGRYPEDKTASGKPRKPSTVLAFAPLPLGNVERGMDSLGLTAMLTPYLLVIVSTTPVAQTQHKAARPKEVEPHSAMSGCLAWFPAVKLKVKDPSSGAMISRVKLVYCWSNILTVLDVEEVDSPDQEKPPSLYFKARSRWKAEEAIVAVQWISRSVLTVLTITQRLIVLEDNTMRMTEGFDLIGKHIFHRDIFSEQLHNLVERLDEEDSTMHGVVADAFYMSFRAYKGRMFLLGFSDISIGTLTNWADRLFALVEHGDYIAAILLANSYYTGDNDKLTVGLPEDTMLRHTMVRDKLMEIMSASLEFAFGQQRVRGEEGDRQLKALADACFEACLSVNNVDFLFGEAFEWYEDAEMEGIFLEALEPYILAKDISVIPPTVVKALVTYYVATGLESRLEDIICQMETATLDLDELTTLCKQHNLYDALIYVWNQALGDYITPLIDLLSLLIPLVQPSEYSSAGDLMEDPIYGVNALKMFPYLSYTFTGRRYPSGDKIDDADASKAKAELYWFLFSGKTVIWPKGGQKQILARPNGGEEPSYPYLRMILTFDAPSFLSSLNEAFEDSFLNDTPDRAVNGGIKPHNVAEEQVFGLSVNRQLIVSVLLEVMNSNDFAPEDTIYLDMFIARNLPKFPQYLLLSGTALHKVLEGLCNYPGDDIADDAQLSAEYLMSVYHPSDLPSLMPLFEKAGFYRVLKSIYRADKQYAKLIQAFFDDQDDQDEIFECIRVYLGPGAAPTKKQIADVHSVLEAHAMDLVGLNTTQTARTIDDCAPSLHQHFINILESEPEFQYNYLRAILEPRDELGEALKSTATREKFYYETYVQLMCTFNSTHVVDYVNSIEASDLRLDRVLQAMEDTGVIDAAVTLMAREGQMREAMDRLVKHFGTLEAALLGVVYSSKGMQVTAKEEAAEDLLCSLQRYANVGIWLCNGQAKLSRRQAIQERRKGSKKENLLPDEHLWLDLIDVMVQVTKSVSQGLQSSPSNLSSNDSPQSHINTTKLLTNLRGLVQSTFTALLVSTSSQVSTNSAQSSSFLRILRAFLTRASFSSPNLSDLRAVLSSIFSAYAYEESILSLTNRLLDKDLFVGVKEANELRLRGWRPKGSVCEGCRRRLWGPGAAGNVYKKWEERRMLEAEKREERILAQAAAVEENGARGKAAVRRVDIKQQSGNGKEASEVKGVDEDEGGENDTKPEEDLGPLIVLACRHIYHRSCLEKAYTTRFEGDEEPGDGREFRCPIDG